MNTEIWKQLIHSSLYEVSNYGNVRAVPRKVNSSFSLTGYRLTKPKSVALTDNGHGYKLFGTCVDGKKKNFYIHRAVAELFIANPYNYSEVNHIDGIKANNHFSNLEWVNTQQNRDHAVRLNLILFGESSPNAKLKEYQVIEILQAHQDNPNLNRTHLGRKYKVRENAVIRIINGERWRRTYDKFHSPELLKPV